MSKKLTQVKPNVEIEKDMFKMFKAVLELAECLDKKCSIEKKILESSSNYKEIIELNKKIANKDITMEEFIKKTKLLLVKVARSAENLDMVKCKLENCYDKTKFLLELSIENILKKKQVDTPLYKQCVQFNKIIKNKKLTPDVLIEMNLALVKIITPKISLKL